MTRDAVGMVCARTCGPEEAAVATTTSVARSPRSVRVVWSPIGDLTGAKSTPATTHHSSGRGPRAATRDKVWVIRMVSVARLGRVTSFGILAAAATAASVAFGAQALTPDFYGDLSWRCIGPFDGGPVASVAGVPGEAGIYVITTPSGGAWKTDRRRRHVDVDRSSEVTPAAADPHRWIDPANPRRIVRTDAARHRGQPRWRRHLDRVASSAHRRGRAPRAARASGRARDHDAQHRRQAGHRVDRRSRRAGTDLRRHERVRATSRSTTARVGVAAVEPAARRDQRPRHSRQQPRRRDAGTIDLAARRHLAAAATERGDRVRRGGALQAGRCGAERTRRSIPRRRSPTPAGVEPRLLPRRGRHSGASRSTFSMPAGAWCTPPRARRPTPPIAGCP